MFDETRKRVRTNYFALVDRCARSVCIDTCVRTCVYVSLCVHVCVNFDGRSEKKKNRADLRRGYITRLSVGIRNQIEPIRSSSSSSSILPRSLLSSIVLSPSSLSSSTSTSVVLQLGTSFQDEQRRPLRKSMTLAEREKRR